MVLIRHKTVELKFGNGNDNDKDSKAPCPFVVALAKILREQNASEDYQ